MKKIRFIGLITLIAVMTVGCGTKVLDESGNSNLDESSTNAANDIESNTGVSSTEVRNAEKTTIIESNNTDLDTDEQLLPTLASNASVDWECGTYYSDISKENMETFLQRLVEDGWKDTLGDDISTEIAEGTSQYTLTKGNNLLQMMMFLMDQEVSICNSILLKVDENISLTQIENRIDALTKEEALEKIQVVATEMVKQGEVPDTKGIITGVFEIFIDGAYDKMKLQAYAAISDYGFSGCFLIRNGVTSFVEGSLDNACVLDVDDDGTYEVVDLYTTWEAGIYKIELIAYEYVNPVYFSSLTEILQRKYYNCFVPESGYEELRLIKVDDNTVQLVGEALEYGTLKVEGTALLLKDMKDFPFEQWSISYDQSQLFDMEKEYPTAPPEIVISINGLGVDYVVQDTQWDTAVKEFTTTDALTKIMDKDQFIPTFQLDYTGKTDEDKLVTINFGKYIPDSIKIYDAMLDDAGAVRYKLSMEQTVKILDGSRVSFDLKQHMAHALSSNSRDYEKDWRRLFRIVCKWGEKETTYAFMINTGKTEALTEIADNHFLNCEGSFSPLSSSWGLGISLDLSIVSKDLPKQYVIEWQFSDGFLRKWSEKSTKPIGITDQHNGYPMTYSDDNNNGTVIWAPISFDMVGDVTIRAYIYKTAEDKSPVAYSEITLKNNSGVFYKKLMN